MKKKAIICDLDGTLCLFGNKDPYDRDFGADEQNPAVIDLLWRIDNDNFNGFGEWTEIVFVSGRNEKYRQMTKGWLIERGFEIYPLLMRKDGDFRKDVVVKSEIYETQIKDNYDVQYVFDDRDRVVEFWRAIGLTCFQVAKGDF